nr:HAMP domain-containing sensor histidine kinase [Siphonobacter sp. BAB-5405]
METSLTYDSNVQELKKGMSQAVRELDKLTALSNGLLQLAQLDNVQIQIDKQPLDVVELVLEVADLLGQQKPGQTLSVNVSQDVLEQSTPVLILGNPYLLRTALYNLLDNAVKYSQGQPVSFSLEITQDQQAHIRILDQGIGLTPGEEERILQPLVRGSNVQRIEGFGVGLTLTHRIVLLHQGQLTLSPRESGGTCAEVQLPLYS